MLTLIIKKKTKLFHILEGLAVGVGFGAIGKTPLATFNKAK